MNINTVIINGKLAHQVKIIEETNEKEASEQQQHQAPPGRIAWLSSEPEAFLIG